MNEYIICAAIWFKDDMVRKLQPINIEVGIVICGHRHANIIYQLAEMYPDRRYILLNDDGKTTIQGFLTNKNRFVNRAEAAQIALNAKQVESINLLSPYLFSEDLY